MVETRENRSLAYNRFMDDSSEAGPGGQPRGTAASLTHLTGGDPAATAQLMDVVYDELRAVAGRYFGRQQPGHTLQPTALVHEAFLRVADRTGAEYASRAHFAAVCAIAMRGILTDHARGRATQKRGGDRQRA